MNTIMKMKINNLATMFYIMQGYVCPDEYDIQQATHPDEKRCWNQAVVAWAHLSNDPKFIEYQN